MSLRQLCARIEFHSVFVVLSIDNSGRVIGVETLESLKISTGCGTFNNLSEKYVACKLEEKIQHLQPKSYVLRDCCRWDESSAVFISLLFAAHR